jgi:hypothetical protein
MVTILQYAAGVTTVLSLLSFFGGLYVWLQSQKREQSVVDVIKGEGIVQAATVVRILKEFKSDETRLAALQQVLGYSKDRAADVLDKVKPNVDVGKLSLVNQVNLQRRLLLTGVILIFLAALSILASRSEHSLEPTNPAPTTEAKPEHEQTVIDKPESVAKPKPENDPHPSLSSKGKPGHEQTVNDKPASEARPKPESEHDPLKDQAVLRELLEANWKSPWNELRH